MATKSEENLVALSFEEPKRKRSYCLPESTIQKLSELKIYKYPLGTSLEDIVNEAILKLYKSKIKK